MEDFNNAPLWARLVLTIIGLIGLVGPLLIVALYLGRIFQ